MVTRRLPFMVTKKTRRMWDPAFSWLTARRQRFQFAAKKKPQSSCRMRTTREGILTTLRTRALATCMWGTAAILKEGILLPLRARVQADTSNRVTTNKTKARMERGWEAASNRTVISR